MENKVQHLKQTIIEKGNKKLKRRIYNICFISFAKNLEIDLCNALFAELPHLTGSSKSARCELGLKNAIPLMNFTSMVCLVKIGYNNHP